VYFLHQLNNKRKKSLFSTLSDVESYFYTSDHILEKHMQQQQPSSKAYINQSKFRKKNTK